MDPGDQTLSLETFNTWKVDSLREFLSKRGLPTDGTKAELVALCFSAHIMKLPLKLSDVEYLAITKQNYQELLQIRGDSKIPDPLSVSGGWLDEKTGISKWPPVFISDIFTFLADKGTSESLKRHMNSYKIGKAFEYVQSGYIKEVFYHPISKASEMCFLRGKCTPSQRLKDEPHTIWVCIVKSSGEVMSAFCSCTAGLGQTCNHIAALLFRLELANKLAMTACTSLPCTWNVPSETKSTVHPTMIKDMSFLKSQHGKVKSRPFVSSVKKTYQPQDVLSVNKESLLDDLRKNVPNACLFKGTDVPKLSKVTPLQVYPDHHSVDLSSLYMHNIIKRENMTVTSHQIKTVQESTVGQGNNPVWHLVRKGRTTASNFYSVYTRMNTYQSNHMTDMTTILSTIMGDKEVNPNIRAIKFGRESEPLAKELYCNVYKKIHVNASTAECGIFLDKDLSFLAASPDMLVSCDCCGSGLLEVKSVYTQKCHLCSNFCICKLPEYLYMENNSIEIKTNHKYFCQIQGQMYVTGRKWCDLFVYSCNGTIIK